MSELIRIARRGRGALTNPAGRFERVRSVPCDDGWNTLAREIDGARKVETVVHDERARNIFATNDSPDIPFNRSINPYRGCEHGCIYCYARPSHGYLGHSAGVDFETQIYAKTNAADVLRRALRRPGYTCENIALGANTDPYQPVERRTEITRSILEVLWEHRHPVSIVTKSRGVLRDLDILAPMARRGLAAVFVSVTTLDDALARAMEPRASAPGQRLAALAGLAEAGVPCGVMYSPVVPAINDHELEAVLAAARRAGARRASYILLRLPFEVRELFTEWLHEHFPDRAQKVLRRIRSMKDGKLNETRFGLRMTGSGEYGELLRVRFDAAMRRLGYAEECIKLETARFRVPPARGDQRHLFS